MIGETQDFSSLRRILLGDACTVHFDMLCRVPTESGKIWKKVWSFSSLGKNFRSVSMGKENNFPDLIFSLKIVNWTFIVLTSIVSAFDLGLSFGIVLVWKKPRISKLRRSPGFVNLATEKSFAKPRIVSFIIVRICDHAAHDMVAASAK